jgi:hypothetical protein
LQRKYTFPASLQVVEDVTKLLPDDTWLTQLEMKTTARGKDAHREVVLRGESANAGRLVSLLEDSKVFEQAAPRSPTTKIQPGPGEIFDLGAQLKTLPLPQPMQLAGRAPAATVPAQPGTPGGVEAAAPPGQGERDRAFAREGTSRSHREGERRRGDEAASGEARRRARRRAAPPIAEPDAESDA